MFVEIYVINISHRILTSMNGRKDGEGDEEREEDIEALREAPLEDAPVGDGVDHATLLLLQQRAVVHMVMVTEEALTRTRRKVDSDS